MNVPRTRRQECLRYAETGAGVKADYAWRDLGYRSAPKARDLRLRQDLPRQKNFTAEIPPHGCVLLQGNEGASLQA